MVELVEPLGHDTYLTCRGGSSSLVARAPADEAYATGERIVLTVDPGGVRLFERATGCGIQG